MGYRCVYDGKRLGIRSPLTLEEYLAHPHLVTPTQTDFRGAVDDELVGHSKRRTVIYTTSRFAALPLIFRRADVIATVPEQSAQHWAEVFGLTSSPVPVRIAPSAISMIWHAKRESDTGLQWLRDVVRGIVESEMSEISGKPRPARNAAGAREDRHGLFFCFDAFSLREPVSTSLENAMAVRTACGTPRSRSGPRPCRRAASPCGWFRASANRRGTIRQAVPVRRRP